jgi:hypothetical protein
VTGTRARVITEVRTVYSAVVTVSWGERGGKVWWSVVESALLLIGGELKSAPGVEDWTGRERSGSRILFAAQIVAYPNHCGRNDIPAELIGKAIHKVYIELRPDIDVFGQK